MSLKNVDIPTLRRAIAEAQKLVDLASPIVLSFDQYAKRITSPVKRKTLDGEMLVLNAAVKDVRDYGRALIAVDEVLADMSERELTAARKKKLIGTLLYARSGICDAMGVVIRTVPKRTKLYGKANRLLSHIKAQTVFGRVH